MIICNRIKSDNCHETLRLKAFATNCPKRNTSIDMTEWERWSTQECARDDDK